MSEFVAEHRIETDRTPHQRKALIQVHCHEHALAKPELEKQTLEQFGVDAEIMPNGCCGMAGSFGFEAAKYPWSVKIAEHALLPRLRQAEPDAAIVASGFSCREQIEQLTGRKTQHLAEIMADALGVLPPPPPPRAPDRQFAIAAVAIAGVALAGLALAAVTSRVAASYRAGNNGVRREDFGASSASAAPAASPMPASSHPR